MRVAIHGLVTASHLADAALFAGIEPTAFLTTGSGRLAPGVAPNLPITTMPRDPLVLGEAGVRQSFARLAVHADAVICIGQNNTLVEWAGHVKAPLHQA